MKAVKEFQEEKVSMQFGKSILKKLVRQKLSRLIFITVCGRSYLVQVVLD